MSKEQIDIFEDNPEYEAFVNKFKPKLTTDDCYTPPEIYEAVYSVEDYDKTGNAKKILYKKGDEIKGLLIPNVSLLRGCRQEISLFLMFLKELNSQVFEDMHLINTKITFSVEAFKEFAGYITEEEARAALEKAASVLGSIPVYEETKKEHDRRRRVIRSLNLITCFARKAEQCTIVLVAPTVDFNPWAAIITYMNSEQWSAPYLQG